MNKIKEALFSSTYTLKERLFFLGGLIGTIAMFAAFVVSVALADNNFMVGIAPLIGTFVVGAITYYSLTNKRIEIGSIFLVLISICFVLPYGFLKGGGIYSGSPTWFVIGFVIVFLLYNGKKFYIFYFITIISFALTIYISYKHPELVVPLQSIEAIYFDQFIACLLVATIIGVLQHYQSVILEREIKISDQQHKEIEDLNEAQNTFFSSMSHEIRTPINTIIGLNETTLRQKNLPDDVVENSLNIQNASRMLLSLINDILDLSKIQSGRMELTEAQYETSRMFSEIVNLLWNRAKDKGLQFNINVGESIPSMLYGDEMRIKQVIINLLTNAIKYTEEGSVTLTVDGEKTKTNTFMLRVSVNDTGQGIRKESIPVIFDSFKRVNKNENKSIEGTGLGLSITKQLVDLMGGQITVDSIYTKGSTFRVNIPQRIVSEVPINFKTVSDLNKDLKEYHQTFEAPDARVLIVDDNDMNRMVCQKLLRETKVKTDAVATGKECLDLTLQNHYDVIFMDHEMPEMDGIETLRRLRNQANGLCQNTPVIALTANAGSDRNSFYMEHGFQAYLAKPIHGSLLEATLMQLLPEELIENIQSSSNENVVQVLQNKKKKHIIVSTDSTCDLPLELVSYYDIRVIPNYIVTEKGRFRDNEELDANNLYHYLMENEGEVSTEAAMVDEYEEFFGDLLAEADQIIHLSTTPVVSLNYKNASSAAQSFDNVKIVNAGSISAGLGMVVLKAGELALKDKSVDEIIEEINEYQECIITNFLIPSIDLIAKRYHLSPITKGLIKIFNFDICYSIKKERMVFKRFYPGYFANSINQYVMNNFKNHRNINTKRLYVIHSGYSNEEREEVLEEIKKYIEFEEIYVEKSSAVLTANSGSKFIGFSYEKIKENDNTN